MLYERALPQGPAQRCCVTLCGVWQALPTSYESVAPASGAPSRSRVVRVVAAAAMVMLACAALVALLGSATEQTQSSLLAVTPDQSLDALALQFLKHGATMSVKDMKHELDAWHNSPATLLNIPANVGTGRTQMLALGPRSSGESFGEALDGEHLASPLVVRAFHAAQGITYSPE